MRMPSLLLMLVLAAPVPVPAQVAGHSTLPTTGPAARERGGRPAEDDAVLVQVDRLRRDLADLGKRYRKAGDEERQVLARRAQPLLDEMASRLRELTADSSELR